jgi:hypothetical protein
MKNLVVKFLFPVLFYPLVIIGIISLVDSTKILSQKDPSQEYKIDALKSFSIGVSSIACVGWMIWYARRKELEELEQLVTKFLELDSRLRSILEEQIQSNQGIISCINFAAVAEISIEESQQYLNIKSVELDGKLNIDESEAISYHFPLPRNLV